MAFTFEALQARYGDSLLLTFADPGRTLRLLVDGGPSDVYRTSLRPRLEAERRDLPDGLTLDAVMISHIDEDHILGILDMFGELLEADRGPRPRPWDVRWLLHNSFDALLDGSEGAVARAIGGRTVLAGLGGALNQALKDRLSHTSELVLQSYGQGSDLASLAASLEIARNPPDGSPIISTAKTRVLQLGKASLNVIGPRGKEIEKLRKDWLAWIEADKKKKPPTAALAARLDSAVANLSSLAVLVSHGGKTALLTGDGRADYIYDGLKAAGLTNAAGKLHVDILKMPHHGSIRNVTEAFLRDVTADHYVASGDGTFGNPDRATLDLIEKARPAGGFEVHITYEAESCDRTHEAWKTARPKLGPYVAARDGITPVIKRWKAAGKIKVHEGPVLIEL